MKVKHITFEKDKKTQRYILSPRERVLAFLKLNKEATLFQVSTNCYIQYDMARQICSFLQNEGQVVIITETGYGVGGFQKIISTTIKYKGDKK